MSGGVVMDDNLKWGVGIFAGLFATLGGWIIGAFRNQSKKIATLHQRVDDVRKEYVRRDDFAARMDAVEKLFDVKLDAVSDEVSNLRDDLADHNRAVLKALNARSQ